MPQIYKYTNTKKNKYKEWKYTLRKYPHPTYLLSVRQPLRQQSPSCTWGPTLLIIEQASLRRKAHNMYSCHTNTYIPHIYDTKTHIKQVSLWRPNNMYSYHTRLWQRQRPTNMCSYHTNTHVMFQHGCGANSSKSFNVSSDDQWQWQESANTDLIFVIILSLQTATHV